MHGLISIFSVYTILPVADPHLQIGVGEGGEGVSSSHPDAEIRGVPDLPKNFFLALQALFWSKNRGGGPPRPLPLIHHWLLKEKLLVTT